MQGCTPMSTGTTIKTLTLARRRTEVSHEQLEAHWRDPHAPGVAAHMKPDRYAITFFAQRNDRVPFDGMAALFYADADRAASLTGRNTPPAVANDGWVDRVEQPMIRLQVDEHVIVPGPGGLDGTPATSAQREAAFKMTFLVKANEGEDIDAIHRHWLELHAPNVASNFAASGGVRYVINLAPRLGGGRAQPYVGIAELSYRDRDAFKSHLIDDDGFNARTNGLGLQGRELVVVS